MRASLSKCGLVTSLGVIDLGNQWNQPIALTTILINHQWYSVAYAGEQLLRNGQNIYSLSGFQNYEFNIAGASHQDHWVITGNVAFSHKISTVILKNIIWRTIEQWKNISAVNNDCMFIFKSALFLFMPYLFVVVAKPGVRKWILTHLSLVTHICVSELGEHCFR